MISVTVRVGDRLTVNGQLSVVVSEISSDGIELRFNGIAIQRLDVHHPSPQNPAQDPKAESVQHKVATAPKPVATQSGAATQSQPKPQVSAPPAKPQSNGHHDSGHVQQKNHRRKHNGAPSGPYGMARTGNRRNGFPS